MSTQQTPLFNRTNRSRRTTFASHLLANSTVRTAGGAPSPLSADQFGSTSFALVVPTCCVNKSSVVRRYVVDPGLYQTGRDLIEQICFLADVGD
jgi:hypothetical protein